MKQSPVLLITGGSSGIGQATAMWFVLRGYHVYEMSRRANAGEGIVHLSGDVTIATDCQKVVSGVLEREGVIDLLICNAGMGISGAVEFTSEEEMHRQMEVNFFGVVNMVQAVLPHMRQRKAGRILFVSSIAAHFSIPFQSFYSASKSAVNGFALALRNEVSPFGIQVGCLLPGDVKTGFTASRVKSMKGTEVYPQMSKAVGTMEHDETNGQSPDRIARRLYCMARRRCLPIYTYEGCSYHFLAFLHKILPDSLINWIVGKLY